MSDIEAKLRLRAEFGDALKALNGLRAAVRDVTSGASASPAGDVPFRGMRSAIKSISVQLAEAKTQLLALVGVQMGLAGASGLARIVDEYASMSARLRLVTGSQQAFNAALAQTRSLAQQYQAPLASTTALYTRMYAAIKPLGGGAREAQAATESMLASLKISGATAEESSSAILQFSQALSAGVLHGQEFNAMTQAAPRLLDALAAGMGKPRGELKALAEQGKLTTSAIVEALSKELPKLQAEAAKMPPTIGGAIQQLRDRFSSLAGASLESSEAVRLVIGAISALSDALPQVLVLLGGIAATLAAFKLGALAQGLWLAAAGAKGAATGFSALFAVLRAGLAAVTGPVGWIVALVSLAAAWAGLGEAQKKVQATTRESLAAERERVDAEIARREQWVRDNPGGTLAQSENGEALLRLRAQRRELVRQAAEFDRKAWEEERAADKRSGEEGSPLRDPASVKAFEDDYKSRQRIVQEFEQRRAGYVVAKDREIAAARASGQAELERRLTDEKQASLKEQAKAEKEALKKYDADTTLTRMAVYKEHYDRLADLAQDAAARGLKANQSAFDALLQSSKTYFAQRARLEDEESQQVVERLRDELARKQKVLADNEGVLRRLKKQGTANEVQAAQETLTQNQADVDKARAEVEKASRDAEDKRQQRLRDEVQITRELQRQSAEIVLQTRQLNDEVTAADLRADAERRFAEQRRREQAETGSTQETDALIEATVRVAEIVRLQQRIQAINEQVRQAEAEIDEAVRTGATTTVDAERQKFAARAKAVPQLQAIVELLDKLAHTDAEKAAVANVKLGLAGLKDQTTELENTLRDSVGSAARGLFNDIVTGSKTAGEAVRDAIGNIGRAMLDLINRRLGEQLVNSLFGTKDGSGDGGWLAAIGKIFSSYFGSGSTSAAVKHSGGIVGEAGASRAMNLAAFVGAPRYHSGGIAGLRPNEVAAVLERGEEVLRADDPRHRNNIGRAVNVGDIKVNVSLQQGGDVDAQKLGQHLGSAIEATVYDVMVRESREGGLLAGGRR